MTENERKAIVWDTVERLAFHPNPPENWLSVYAKTLHRLWGIPSSWDRFARDDKIDIPFLMLTCNYRIEDFNKYSASLIKDSSTDRYWINHIDPDFLSKGALHSSNNRYPHNQMKNLQKDIEAVLDGMIFHPRCHMHIKDLGINYTQLDQNRGALNLHEIRISGGIENPYVFLFHLRYQFCLVHSDSRNAERQRLIDLFVDAIQKKKASINPQILFDFSR